ncbi:MAG TPA: cysteine synthase A [Acidobacteriaceae bacterium]|jgi:cysteine synthase A
MPPASAPSTLRTARDVGAAADITDLIGRTPVLQLRRLTAPNAADLFAKLEFLNPGGSVKDRAALGMILDAERRGVLHKNSIITEATAGNTGVGLALVGVNRGYRVVLYVPEGFAEEKCILMRGFGAEVHRTPEGEGMAGAIRRAQALAASDPNVWAALQFDNPANPQFHHDTTAVELWEQMDGRIDAFIAGVGTGGTFSGIARFLKEQNPDILTVAVETEGSILQGGKPGPHKVEGIGVHFIPNTFDRSAADEIVAVTDTDAFAMVRQLAAKEGLLAGSSSGAMIHAACAVAARLGAGKRVATLIPDSAERYLSKRPFEEGE